MREIVAYAMVPKAGLPSAEEKAGLVVEEVIRNPVHVDYWRLAETTDGQHWTDFTDWVDRKSFPHPPHTYTQFENARLYDILRRKVRGCVEENRCSEFRVEDWSDGEYRVAVTLVQENTITLSQEGGPIPPYAAEVQREAGIARWFKPNRLAWVGVGLAAAVGGYFLVRKVRKT
jgi:hypothetical protein